MLCICCHWAKRDTTVVLSHLWCWLLDPSKPQPSSNVTWTYGGIHGPVRVRRAFVEQTLHLNSCEACSRCSRKPVDDLELGSTWRLSGPRLGDHCGPNRRCPIFMLISMLHNDWNSLHVCDTHCIASAVYQQHTVHVLQGWSRFLPVN